MRSFFKLSRAGQLRRLREVAVDRLTRYDLDRPVLAYHGFDTNLLYRVVTRSGDRFMMRLATPGWRTYENLVSEAAWLEALDRDTDIPVPVIVRTRSGESVISEYDDRILNTWNTSLMRWVPGRDLGNYLTPGNLRLMGILFAKLHKHGKEWKRPAHFSNQRFDGWLSRGEPNLLADLPPSIPAHERAVMDEMHREVAAAFESVDPDDLRVIHCDLWHDNIRIRQGVLHPLDFEDTVLGFRSHDIGMAMLDLLEDTDEQRYQELLAAFRCGYETLLDWPEAPIERFQIGRLLWKINWVARHENEWLADMIRRHVPVFERYARTGEITLPTEAP